VTPKPKERTIFDEGGESTARGRGKFEAEPARGKVSRLGAKSGKNKMKKGDYQMKQWGDTGVGAGNSVERGAWWGFILERGNKRSRGGERMNKRYRAHTTPDAYRPSGQPDGMGGEKERERIPSPTITRLSKKAGR